ncbi:DUF2793 domain-containing protein [Novosphingobium sp. G106]|uniref:DUF2793 domain-containing protein n=1 Tax=Novosphingobium sp. G106 TaxID=2849500 RepID=UPI0020C2E4D5|nr:DUF2793 domain-containing protein [Novosphingobium sp. G106]
MLHPAIDSEATSPPPTPVDGESWLVASAATGDWAGQDGKLACRQSGNWLFVAPRDGMRLLDRSMGQERRFFRDLENCRGTRGTNRWIDR